MVQYQLFFNLYANAADAAYMLSVRLNILIAIAAQRVARQVKGLSLICQNIMKKGSRNHVWRRLPSFV
jgi:hypothetical protein